MGAVNQRWGFILPRVQAIPPVPGILALHHAKFLQAHASKVYKVKAHGKAVNVFQGQLRDALEEMPASGRDSIQHNR